MPKVNHTIRQGVLFGLFIIFSSAAVAEKKMTASFCKVIKEVMQMTPTLGEAQRNISIDKETYPCSLSENDSRWICTLGELRQCRPKDGEVSSKTDPDFLIVVYKTVVDNLNSCVSDHVPEQYQNKEGIVDRYVKVTKGTRYNNPLDIAARAISASMTGLLQYDADQICESMSVVLTIE